MASRASRFVIGAIGGLVATVPMTALMLCGKKRLSWRSQEPLPPTKITRRALRAVGLHDDLSRGQKNSLTAVNHFAYGAGAGAVYGQIFSPRTVTTSIATGATYGLAVWTGSYCGWLPVIGLYRSAARDTTERNALMIAAHLVWGSSLGLTAFLFSGRTRPSTQRLPADT